MPPSATPTCLYYLNFKYATWVGRWKKAFFLKHKLIIPGLGLARCKLGFGTSSGCGDTTLLAYPPIQLQSKKNKRSPLLRLYIRILCPNPVDILVTRYCLYATYLILEGKKKQNQGNEGNKQANE